MGIAFATDSGGHSHAIQASAPFVTCRQSHLIIHHKSHTLIGSLLAECCNCETQTKRNRSYVEWLKEKKPDVFMKCPVCRVYAKSQQRAGGHWVRPSGLFLLKPPDKLPNFCIPDATQDPFGRRARFIDQIVTRAYKLWTATVSFRVTQFRVSVIYFWGPSFVVFTTPNKRPTLYSYSSPRDVEYGGAYNPTDQ